MATSLKSDDVPQPVRRLVLERRSLHDQVVEALREMVVLGELAPGSRIVESELAERLGVSRTPMRGAIKTLVLDGLVDSQIHRGARVKLMDPGETASLFEVIAIIEALAAETAARQASPADLADLRSLHDQMRGRFSARDRDAYFDLNTAIHEWIVRLGNNAVLADTHARLMLRARRARYLAIFSASRWAEAMEEHERVMQAFAEKDSAAAFQVWRTHLANTGEAVQRALSEGLSR